MSHENVGILETDDECCEYCEEKYPTSELIVCEECEALFCEKCNTNELDSEVKLCPNCLEDKEKEKRYILDTQLEDVLYTDMDKEVAEQLKDGRQDDEDFKNYVSDVLTHGCASGIVGSMIYYQDTLAFFERFKTEISEMLVEELKSTGLSIDKLFHGWDVDDPLALDVHNQNLLAWFGFEETTRSIASRLHIEY